ncbi:2,4-dihydroxyhept-2-enedioate aldolase [Faunimonas pinastri]|uniref:2,4-dihydroxyhept-2-enedioate aldolase n=1 Tax=Faunimonas pinastri TaxID=1855383 RepID=A0A1H9K0G8_9HYPH|nr:aldolase/citrate lyase family protein [Faunimonas pinastri]SEQ92612.1 2,4-dihydroxyhept-2-enedioate aldolase [Faunimonas pinastri]
MELAPNTFKRAILAGRQQIGCWCTLSTSTSVEVVAGSGFDWLLLDTEHSPADVLSVLPMLQALSGYPVAPVVRPVGNDPVLIKRYLDFGVQTLLIPYVQNAAEARAAAEAVAYPPAGIRDVSSLTRATRYGRLPDYFARARQEICLLVQVESLQAVDQIEAIAAVEGVDGIFIGPADLAASMGHNGNLGHPDVRAAVGEAIRRIRACGKPAGILTGDPAFAQHCIELGTVFTAVGIDMGLLANAADALARKFGRGSAGEG